MTTVCTFCFLDAFNQGCRPKRPTNHEQSAYLDTCMCSYIYICIYLYVYVHICIYTYIYRWQISDSGMELSGLVRRSSGFTIRIAFFTWLLAVAISFQHFSQHEAS